MDFTRVCACDVVALYSAIADGAGTSSISMYSFNYLSHRVHLIDTPGFDDSYRSESEILQEVAYWLTKAYQNGFLLNGIVYLYSIAQPRWTASAEKSLAVLKALCGPESYEAVVLATTFWDLVDRDEAHDRARQLVQNHARWGEMTAAGSMVRAHAAGYPSAMEIIKHIVTRDKKYTLLIQREMDHTNKELLDTTAGREVHRLWIRDIENFKRKLNDTRADVTSKSRESKQRLKEEIASLEKAIATRQDDISDLSQTTHELHQEWEARIKADVTRLERELAKCQEELTLVRRGRVDSVPSGALNGRVHDEDLERRLDQRKNELNQEKMTKLTSYGMVAGVASALFGGVSVAITAAPILLSCCIA